MQTLMTTGDMPTLFGAMVILAAVPGVSVMTVIARTAAGGFRQGVWTTLGIVAGDTVFILIALVGVSFLANTLADGFVLVQFASGVFLIGTGVNLWRAPSSAGEGGYLSTCPGFSSFLAGLLLTLGDQKALLFYLAFLPAFLDHSRAGVGDVMIMLGIAAVAITGTKLGYVAVTLRYSTLLPARAHRTANKLAAGVVLIAGVAIVLNTWTKAAANFGISP
jgi:threonine/homoserine/homoserine lactone efflux protein